MLLMDDVVRVIESIQQTGCASLGVYVASRVNEVFMKYFLCATL